ncbi:MAG: glycerophosphodiester phosphodiesterase, partial [Verrucomicrobia bacterium]|nr:glycerophosphodiester phosphodiesterase [Verrucomicrobiota bacterium]
MTAVIAHRGASTDAPENTLAAFRLAWEQGADAVEMDLWPTRDGRIAVIHDADLRRVGSSRRKVSALEASELKTFDVGAWKDAHWAGERVPLLDEVLATVPQTGRVFLELKGGSEMLPELSQCIGQSGLDASQISIIAFKRPLLLASKKLLPDVERVWVIGRPSSLSFGEVVKAAVGSGLDGLDFSASWPLDRSRVEEAHRARLKVYVWT